jgi:polyhydroxyalkanoate depolymerase
MIYNAYKAFHDLAAPARWTAGLMAETLRQAEFGQWFWPALPIAAACEMVEGVALTHERPAWEFGPADSGEREFQVLEEKVLETPFATLLRFRRSPGPVDLPKVLVLAPISGHFATLLRPTVQTLLADHDVYVTDWKNARDVPVSAGRFGFDEHIDHVLQFMRAVGPGAHLFAVCQPCPSAIAATALLSQDNDPATPASLILMAGPVDTRINPTAVSSFAETHSLDWFEQTMITRVPLGMGGYRRKVYPGFMQIAAFMSMNLERHVSTHVDLFRALARGEAERAEPIRAFYDEYYAVSDLTAEFFLETVDRVFQRFLLAEGQLAWRGRRVDPSAITRTPLMTIEGERDDICSPGQTAAAHGLLTGLPDEMKRLYVQEGAGHYGVFSGSRWREGVYPELRRFIAENRPVSAALRAAN